MKILILTKRQYIGKDLFEDHYGRIREIPLELARLGHEVHGVCLSYLSMKEEIHQDVCSRSGAIVKWSSYNAGFIKPLGFFRYYRKVVKLVLEFKPDLVLAMSDSIYGILGKHVARRSSIPFVFDLYDNFESFSAARIPGVISLYRSSIREAQGIIAISSKLLEYVASTCEYKKEILVIGNALPQGLFSPLDKEQCRLKLELPADAILIGTAGALEIDRGVQSLIAAFELIQRKHEKVYLVLAGKIGKNLNIPELDRILCLGTLPHNKIPLFFNSLDVGVICLRDTAFGAFAFPMKFYELIGCKTPFVCAQVGEMELLLKDYPELFYKPNDLNSLAGAIDKQIVNPTVPSITPPDWADLAKQLDHYLMHSLNLG